MKDKLLDRFLFEVKRESERNKKSSASLVPPTPEVSIYANPDNWYSTRVVELVFRDLQGGEESLGFFREERHRISLSARRLRPCPCEEVWIPGTFRPGEVSDREHVTGDYWLRPKEEAKVQDTPHEIEALQRLFQELIGEA